ncbi:hypothetical protein AS200_14410 [Streptomyces sp. CdTB01]|nr:hypothetical protein AS200_14410 [Streptomyces sp. CdTB01]
MPPIRICRPTRGFGTGNVTTAPFRASELSDRRTVTVQGPAFAVRSCRFSEPCFKATPVITRPGVSSCVTEAFGPSGEETPDGDDGDGELRGVAD